MNFTLRERIYDAVRQNAAAGAATIPITVEKLGTWGVAVDSRRDADIDAFFSAMYDLQSEGYISAESGGFTSSELPVRSDRSVGFFDDHRARGAVPSEQFFGNGLSAVSRDDVVLRYPDLARDARFAETNTLFERVQSVDGAPWAFTVSIFPFPVAAFRAIAEIAPDGDIEVDVFAILRSMGKAPAERDEILRVEQPLPHQARLLALERHARVPVVVAAGLVRAANGEIVEAYLNVMRADRYMFRTHEDIVGVP